MKFVSRYAAPNITVESGTQRAITTPSGATVFRDNQDTIEAKFTLKPLDLAEIAAAKEQLYVNDVPGRNGNSAFGSMPLRDEGLISVEEGVAAGYSSLAYQAYDVYQNLSSFDTEDPTQCRPENRETVEAFLLGHYEFGRTYVRVDNWNLTPPWPTYPMADELDEKSAVGVAYFARKGGMLPESLAYERSEKRRANLLAALEAAEAEDKSERELHDGLSAKV